MVRKGFQTKLTSKNPLYFFTSQWVHSSNSFHTNFLLPKHRPFARSSFTRKVVFPTNATVPRNGSLGGNSVKLSSQSSIPVVATATKFTKPIVGYWLLGTAGLVFGIVVLGGLTRLTESGLSIVEWKPITGIIPPLTNVHWEEEFEKYKQFPEYKLLNYNMTLPEFKYIYFMEWAHRIWGRAIGLAFIIPATYFGFRGYMSKATLNKVVGLAGLLGFQGVLGWYMVKSGLSEETMTTPNAVPRVSHYRLAAHLGSAFLLYAGMLLTGLQVLRDAKIANGNFPKAVARALANPAVNTFRRSAIGTTALVFLTSMSGALVAGLDAGLIYNEFPYMGQRIIPPKSELFSKTYANSLWRNFFDNPTTVQFDHRVLAVTTLSVITALWLYSKKVPLPSQAKLAVNYLLGVTGLQITLGISTLIYMVPIPLASAHQAGSLTLLSTALWLVHAMKKMPIKI
ncbi:cytochrome C oxidase assembly protein cox15 [Glomus cerebriforme]|uniref:Cytochrome C oxidase assembly protein cox15 n=1 Tax=Glomus cerebriforme TaxID=658196 RepID=A0A397SQZ6_9GLOM|nr:cytochrome C oxidase assembly protein cox15 [Glomus cerebriforme]